MIRVMISASSSQVKSRLTNLLRSHADFEVVDESIREDPLSVGSATDQHVDVLVAELDEEEGAHSFLENFESTLPTILLVAEGMSGIVESVRTKFRAVLPIDINESRLMAAIEAVAAGLGVFVPDEYDQSVFESTMSAPSNLVEPLTPRETEVLRALADGHGNKEIAARFGISENTVKFHVGSIMGKLGAASRTEAVILGIRHGIVLI